MGFEFQEMFETLPWVGIQAQKWRCYKIETWRRDDLKRDVVTKLKRDVVTIFNWP